MAGRVAGTGQIGAGLVTPPSECFREALAELAELSRRSPRKTSETTPARTNNEP
jgi:hypothetical protein